eukprot:2260698-Amphidinium_carterae.1
METLAPQVPMSRGRNMSVWRESRRLSNDVKARYALNMNSACKEYARPWQEQRHLQRRYAQAESPANSPHSFERGMPTRSAHLAQPTKNLRMLYNIKIRQKQIKR